MTSAAFLLIGIALGYVAGKLTRGHRACDRPSKTSVSVTLAQIRLIDAHDRSTTRTSVLTAVDHRGEQRRLRHREGPERQALAYVYFEDACSGEAANQGRGTAHGGELRQAVGAAA
jgi:hypothetical protein